ncbi:chemotaxis protein CheC [Dechloromonas denitrificans]|uniref:Chemotaxis protein CheC n=1 Tax=Dechloromonas denitrificans TaxID=281362 RepID=A0A133XEU0_9RHOO|nr:chemotaxis protein CheC [Dechloromonas denitrificans]KXB29457.1 chemotaxis protein CheC [Dechloromonas denitrificans]
MPLNELQRDALGEIFNIGVGRAASSLSQIVSDEVLLSAPEVMVVHREQAAKVLLGAELNQFSTVSQSFSGPFDAQAMLVFPESNALEIVRLMVGPHMSIEELSEFEQEAMCEIGNIILNACMSSLADIFHIRFESTLPLHRFGDTYNLPILDGDEEQMVLLLQVDMIISQQRIQGHILFLLSVPSMSALLDHIDRYLSAQGLA